MQGKLVRQSGARKVGNILHIDRQESGWKVLPQVVFSGEWDFLQVRERTNILAAGNAYLTEPSLIEVGLQRKVDH